MTPDEWAAMEEATAHQLVGVAAAEAEKNPIIMNYVRASRKDVRALKAEETRRADMLRKVMMRRAARDALGRKLYKTRNKKSRRGRQGKRTRRARISRIARRTRRARK
jgi:hypothetical protein